MNLEVNPHKYINIMAYQSLIKLKQIQNIINQYNNMVNKNYTLIKI